MILDVVYLRKISRNPISRTRNSFDKRFFELKFEIRMIEAVAAILLFVGTFLGVSTLNEIKADSKTDLENEISILRKETKSLDSIVQQYNQSVDLLKTEEGQSIENLNDVKKEFFKINSKLARNQEDLKYTTRIYVVKNLEYKRKEKKGLSEGAMKFYFDGLTTSKGENLPKFTKRPIISIQTISNGSSLAITEVTEDFVEVVLSYRLASRSNNKEITYKFDIWIAEPN